MIEWLRGQAGLYLTERNEHPDPVIGLDITWGTLRHFIDWLESTGASPWEVVTDGMGYKWLGNGLVFNEEPPAYVIFQRDSDGTMFGMPLPPLPREDNNGEAPI